MTLYKAKVDTKTWNQTIGLIVNPDDVVEIDYKKKTIQNKTTKKDSELKNINLVFDGKKSKKTGKTENTLRERMDVDALFEKTKGGT